MLAVVICERYGWTWEEYQNQPAFFIESIVTKIQAEVQVKEAAERKAKLLNAVSPS